MKQIPDAAVQAALDSWFSPELENHKEFHFDDMKELIAAVIPHLPLGFEVKKLRWHDVDAVCAWCYAESPFGEYRVTWSFNEVGQKLHYPDGSTKLFNEKGYADKDQAKAAAQSDFERRVRECHVPVSITKSSGCVFNDLGITKPVDVAAVREAISSINIHDEANSYEWRGDGDYTPNEQEKALLEDFGNGLVGAIEDAIRSISAEPAQGEP